MGYNRSGTRRTKRMKRAKKHEERLAKKAASEGGAPAESTGVLGAVRNAAAGVAHAVGAAAHAVADTLTGKKKETAPPNG